MKCMSLLKLLLVVLFFFACDPKASIPKDGTPPDGELDLPSGGGTDARPKTPDSPLVAAVCTATPVASGPNDSSLIANKPENLFFAHPGTVHAMTWDGRILITTGNNPASPAQQGWHTVVFRPENIARDTNGVPRFMPENFSERFDWEYDGVPGSTTHNTLAVVPVPDYKENPFRSDENGQPQLFGAYETYMLFIFAPLNEAMDMAIRRGRIVVENPRTPNAKIYRSEMLSAAQVLKATNNKNMRGLEPSVTLDGKLLIYQGTPKNDGGIDYIVYSFNPNPGDPNGWSPPRSIADLYYIERNKLVNGQPFHEIYPIAKQALRDAEGKVYASGAYYYGAYPWISQEGTEIFHTAFQAGCAIDNMSCPAWRRGERALRGGFSVIGRWTNWTMRYIDGPLNPDRFSVGAEPSIRTITNSFGAYPGMWAAFRDVANLPLPYTGQRPLYSLLGAIRGEYTEVSFEDFQDKNYLLFWRMNEMVTRDPKDSKRTLIRSNMTSDTSGNYLNGQLKGATFPQELTGEDINIGATGQAIYFADGASVRAASNARFDAVKKAFTVELFVKRNVGIDTDPPNRYRFLIHKAGSYNLIAEENGLLIASVFLKLPNGQVVERRSTQVGHLPYQQWSHVAFSFDSTTGSLKLYQDGKLLIENKFEAAPVQTTATEFIVGPGGQVTPLWPDTRLPLFVIDEVKLSQVVRSADEIRVSAFVNRESDFLQIGLGLPLGLKAADLRVPANNIPSVKAVELGQRLFRDNRLSRDNNMACATCHRGELGFTDGFDRARGADGKILRRNTPTIFNRALSTRQFWDGRSPTLEAQAIVPIENPSEMNLPIAEAIDRLNADPSYVSQFRATFNAGINADTIGRALASFQRLQLNGNSKVDQFEAGQTNALSESEIRGRSLFHGKARCISCHSGSNYSDEAFHNTGFICTDDLGLEEASLRVRDRRQFKTPTLRGVGVTGPYLHDGSLATLEAVVETYNKGGIHKDNLDAEIKPLLLTPAESQDLVNFLRAL